MKRLGFMLLLVTALAAPQILSAAAERKIGILVWQKYGRFQDSLDKTLSQLKTEGLLSGGTVVSVEYSDGNKAKAMKVAQHYAAQKMDLFFTIGTSATAALAKEVKDVPIVFCTVYDPVDAGFAASWQSSGNNMTGASVYVGVEEVVVFLQKIIPVKNLAVIYTPGEKNSESHLKNLLAHSRALHITIIPVPLLAADDPDLMFRYLPGRVEAVFLTGSGVVDMKARPIIAALTKLRIPTITHVLDYAQEGVFLAVGSVNADSCLVAVKQAAQILQKGLKPADIPIARPQKIQIRINQATGRACGITVPESLIRETQK
ncbi:MAG: ABC transporter substrate-binding protein [Candidatus Omnitrophica bacterium]|nr:ABC transporter substrate-binding protein [Candidatus Omnitrophota bacterium]